MTWDQMAAAIAAREWSFMLFWELACRVVGSLAVIGLVGALIVLIAYVLTRISEEFIDYQ
jgi:uncharacterized membrane protein